MRSRILLTNCASLGEMPRGHSNRAHDLARPMPDWGREGAAEGAGRTRERSPQMSREVNGWARALNIIRRLSGISIVRKLSPALRRFEGQKLSTVSNSPAACAGRCRCDPLIVRLILHSFAVIWRHRIRQTCTPLMGTRLEHLRMTPRHRMPGELCSL